MAKYAVDEEDKLAAEGGEADGAERQDPMQGLEELDVAGPKPE